VIWLMEQLVRVVSSSDAYNKVQQATAQSCSPTTSLGENGAMALCYFCRAWAFSFTSRSYSQCSKTWNHSCRLYSLQPGL